MWVAVYISVAACVLFAALTYNERSRARHGRFDRAMRIGR